VPFEYREQDASADVAAALRRLNALAAEVGDDLEAYAQRLLDIGLEATGCDCGFFGMLEDEHYVARALAGPIEGLWVGDRVNIRETLCATVIAERAPLAFSDLRGDPSALHPALPPSAFGRYIGAPIILDGILCGTLSFVGHEARDGAFTDTHLDLIELFAQNLAGRMRLEAANRALTASRDELRSILDNMPALIWYKDDKNRILKANRAAAQSMGFYDPESLEGADTYRLFPEHARKYHEDDLKVFANGEPLYGIIEPYAPRDGEAGWVSTDKIPLRDDAGQRRILVVANDITRHKACAEALSRLRAALPGLAALPSEDLAEAVDRLLADTAPQDD
jgi:PAS domain S-box-containing protein